MNKFKILLFTILLMVVQVVVKADWQNVPLNNKGILSERTTYRCFVDGEKNPILLNKENKVSDRLTLKIYAKGMKDAYIKQDEKDKIYFTYIQPPQPGRYLPNLLLNKKVLVLEKWEDCKLSIVNIRNKANEAGYSIYFPKNKYYLNPNGAFPLDSEHLNAIGDTIDSKNYIIEIGCRRVERHVAQYGCDLYIMLNKPDDECIANLLKSNPNAVYVVVGDAIYAIEYKTLELVGNGDWLKDITGNTGPNIPIHLSNEAKMTIASHAGRTLQCGSVCSSTQDGLDDTVKISFNIDTGLLSYEGECSPGTQCYDSRHGGRLCVIDNSVWKPVYDAQKKTITLQRSNYLPPNKIKKDENTKVA